MPTITTLTSRAFTRDVGTAKRAADQGPVIITDRGQPAYVLMTHAAWRRLQGKRQRVRDALALPGVEAIEFEAPRLGGISKPADLA